MFFPKSLISREAISFERFSSPLCFCELDKEGGKSQLMEYFAQTWHSSNHCLFRCSLSYPKYCCWDCHREYCECVCHPSQGFWQKDLMSLNGRRCLLNGRSLLGHDCQVALFVQGPIRAWRKWQPPVKGRDSRFCVCVKKQQSAVGIRKRSEIQQESGGTLKTNKIYCSRAEVFVRQSSLLQITT